jgi:hypothetical protein
MYVGSKYNDQSWLKLNFPLLLKQSHSQILKFLCTFCTPNSMPSADMIATKKHGILTKQRDENKWKLIHIHYF